MIRPKLFSRSKLLSRVKSRRLPAVMILLVFAFILAAALLEVAESAGAAERVSSRYLLHGAEETGAINIVSSVLLDYRGFDTLGEATVIFAAVAVVALVMAGGDVSMNRRALSNIVRFGVAHLIPIFWLFPLYVIINGHLSPGGGFHGGVILSVLLILVSVVYGTRFSLPRISVTALSWMEYMSALGFGFIGLIGIAFGSGFLSNASAGFPLGTPGSLMSAGFIPLLNMVIACKVAAGLSAIYYNILRREG